MSVYDKYKEKKPGYLTDATNGGYIEPTKANRHKVKWYCANIPGYTALDYRKKHPPKGYEFVSYIRARDLGLAKGGAIGICAGDLASKIERLAPRYKLMYSESNIVDCCMGKKTGDACNPAWKFNTLACDQVARDYCKDYPKASECGCLLPEGSYKDTQKFGPPECTDIRCAGNVRAYKTRDQRDRKCPDIVNCDMSKVQITGDSSRIDVATIVNACGNTPEERKKIEKELNDKIKKKTGKDVKFDVTGGEVTVVNNNMPWAIGMGIGGVIFLSIGAGLLRAP